MGGTGSRKRDGTGVLGKRKHNSADCEECVLCHKKTAVPRGAPVEQRRHYVEGAGQLCGECWEKTYGKEK